MDSNSNDKQDIKILIERFRELSTDLAVAKDREFSNRFESRKPKSKIKNSLKTHVSRFPFLYRTLIKIKGFIK
jgi:hypothetical protein